jgi:hypothetical protein
VRVTELNGFLKPGFRVSRDFQRQSLAGQSDGLEDRNGQSRWFREGETGRPLDSRDAGSRSWLMFYVFVLEEEDERHADGA